MHLEHPTVGSRRCTWGTGALVTSWAYWHSVGKAASRSLFSPCRLQSHHISSFFLLSNVALTACPALPPAHSMAAVATATELTFAKLSHEDNSTVTPFHR